MPAPNPITGATIITVGSVTTLTDTTLGGTWSSSNTAIATINAGTGLVTAIAPGICQIIYTVGSNSTSVSITVNAVSSLTNGINFNAVYPGILQNRVLWKSQGILSASQRYYEGFHALNDTAILDDLRPNDGSTLTEYLENQQQAVCMEVLNAVYNAPQVIDKPKLAFWRDDMPLPIQLVANQDQFVGLYFYVGKGEHAVKLNNLYLFFNGAALGPFQNTQDELAQQRFVADAERMKIAFDLGVSGIPLLQRPASQLAGCIGQDRGVHGGLHS